jgi:hypothetical protein
VTSICHCGYVLPFRAPVARSCFSR